MKAVQFLALDDDANQQVSYTVFLRDGRLSVWPDDEGTRHVLTVPITDPATDERINADDDPERFLLNLQFNYTGSYVRASNVIDIDENSVETKTWDESKHPRGQPDNKGKFSRSAGAGGKKKKEPPKPQAGYHPVVTDPGPHAMLRAEEETRIGPLDEPLAASIVQMVADAKARDRYLDPSMADLFGKLQEQGVTVDQFKDQILHLAKRKTVRLAPYTRAIGQLGNDARLIVPYNGEPMFYVSTG